MCFWNLFPCKFVILELTTVSKFSCISDVYFWTFERWTHSYTIIGLYFGFRKPNSCIWYGSEFIWTYLNFNVFWTWHSHLDLDLFEMWNECFLWVYSGYTMGMFLVYSGYSMGIPWVYSRLPITRTFKGNRKKFKLSGVRVIRSSKKVAKSKVKNSFLLHSEHFNHI